MSEGLSAWVEQQLARFGVLDAEQQQELSALLRWGSGETAEA